MSAQKHTSTDMKAHVELNNDMGQEVDEWEEEDMGQTDQNIAQSVQDEWEDEEEQVRALVKKTLIEKEKQEEKEAKVAEKVAAKVAARKAKYANMSDQELDFAQFEWVRIFLKTKKENILKDQVYGEFTSTMKASVMQAIDNSSKAVSKRLDKMNCEISESYTQGGDEGDIDEIGVRQVHSRKLVKQLKTTIWCVAAVKEAAQDLSNSLNGFVKVGKRNVKNEVADIMEAIHNHQSVSRGSSACPTPSASGYESSVYESSAYESSVYESSACQTPYENSARQTPYESPATPSAFINLNRHSSTNLRNVLKSSTSSINSEEPSHVEQDNDSQEMRTEGFELMKKRAEEARENPILAQCTRVCDSFKTGKECRHGERCRYAHSLEELAPRRCAFGTECRKIHAKTGNVCECSHPKEDGTWETAAEVVARMNLRVPLPLKREIVSLSEPVGPITNKMTLEERRAVANKHREQLARMERKPEVVEKLTVNVENKEISPAPIAPWAKDKTPTENIEKTPTENIEKTPTENIEKTPTENIEKTPTEKTHEIIECTFDVAIKMMQFIKESGENRNVHWKIIEN